MNHTEEWICELEDRTFKIIQSMENKEKKKMKKSKESLPYLFGIPLKEVIWIIGVLEERRERKCQKA